MLTQQFLESLFGVLRKIHTAHWKTPKLADVQKEIARSGVFVFRIGSDPWVADVKITESGVEYTINGDLPEKMRKRAEEYQEKFVSVR